MGINKKGLEIALVQKEVPLKENVKPAKGRFSLLTLLVMAEAFNQKELYEYTKSAFTEITGLNTESYGKLIGSPDAPDWYNKLAGHILGVVPEKSALLTLVEAGFPSKDIALLSGKPRKETYKKLVQYGLWSSYMRQHHSGRSRVNPRDNEIKELAEKGMSVTEIADYLGISKQGAHYLLKRRPELYELWKEKRHG